jgi:hypothetical protein
MGEAPWFAGRVKRLVAHNSECMFTDDEQPDQFYVQGATIYRDAIGRKGTTWTWHTYICNDPDCPGTVAVRSDVLADVISAALFEAANSQSRPDKLTPEGTPP